jgi:hypothetical protein
MFTSNVLAQIDLEGRRQVHGSDTVHSGLPIGVVDLNNDLLDDVVYLNLGVELNVAYQHWKLDSFINQKIGPCGVSEQWSMVVADLDKNGWKDIVVAGAYEAIKIFYQDAGVFSRKEYAAPELYAQAMNAVDIDGDGWLDLFICSDRDYNEIWWNRDGQKLEKDTLGLFSDLPSEFASGNYGSEWVDVDNDGDLDLYLAKCHPGATSSDDLRRINRLYINQGEGRWMEQAELRGVASGAQSWTGHFSDTDNDGDFDLLVTNHDRSAQLFLNDGGGVYREWTELSGLDITGPVIQSIIEDINGDGMVDIAIGGIPDYLYVNRGFNQFYESADDFGLYNVTTIAKGDLNNDGRVDIYGGYLKLLNEPSALRNEAFINRSESNWLNIYLQGQTGSAESIGAEVRVYSSFGVQSRMIRAGESYGIQNSYKVCIGIGEISRVDSVEVRWPSGVVQKYGPLDGNSWLVVHESGPMLAQDSDKMPLRDTICSGDSIWIEAPSQGNSFIWNDGSQEKGRWISDEGNYQVIVVFSDSLSIVLPGVVIIKDPVVDRSLYFLQGDSIMCYNEEVIIAHEGGREVSWSNNIFGNTLTISGTGSYYGKIQGVCLEYPSDTLDIQYLDEPALEWIQHDTVPLGKQAILVVSDTSAQWYESPSSLIPFFTGDSLVLDSLTSDIYYYVAPVLKKDYPIFRIGHEVKEEALIFHDDLVNATMIFDVLESCRLRSFMAFTDLEGERLFVLYSHGGQLQDSFRFNMQQGWNEIPVDFELSTDVGSYRLTTDTDDNYKQRGTRSPRLASTFTAVEYPYMTTEGTVRIIESQDGWDVYDYFFNWVVQREPLSCEG